MKLETGCHYWYREKIAGYIGAWKIAYIGEDPDSNQWFHLIGGVAIPVAQMKLDHFEFELIKRPKE